MKILFIHQNFPGQYKNLAPALAAQGHECTALTLRVQKPAKWKGVQLIPYAIKRKQAANLHPWLRDTEVKVIRAEACMLAAEDLKAHGYFPDVILAHPGWGEPMFLRDVWPEARIGLFYELFYNADGGDTNFDPEFQSKTSKNDHQRLRLKNINNMLHYPLGDMGLSPTNFQASSFPKAFQDRISVIHDGIDTTQAVPNPAAKFVTQDGKTFTRDDEVVTFVNRNLEPYRGYHIFMRSLVKLLKDRPNAQILITGGDEQSYGPAPHPDRGESWKQIFIDEVRPQISDEDWARLHFLGKIPYQDFLAMLQVSRVHVYLTYPFVLSWSLLEAMSCGAAIVASNTDPVREVISHKETGLLVDFFDPIALADNVGGLLADATLRETLGKNARDFAVQNYDLKSHCLPKQIEWVKKLYDCEAGPSDVYDLLK